MEGDINAVVGKTKLLTSDKFRQFQGLIDKCEAGDPLIKVDDLQGFHDWVTLEVEDLDKAYSRLEERRQNNWIEEAQIPAVQKRSKVTKPISRKPAAASNMRAHILGRSISNVANSCCSQGFFVMVKSSMTLRIKSLLLLCQTSKVTSHSKNPGPSSNNVTLEATIFL